MTEETPKKEVDLNQLQEQFEKQIAENDGKRRVDTDRSILSQTLSSLPTLSSIGKITLRPSVGKDFRPTKQGSVRDFWSWGTESKTTPGLARRGSGVYDFSTDTFKEGSHNNMESLDLSTSQILNDDMSKAEIEKMEIKKKIHDLMLVLNPSSKDANKDGSRPQRRLKEAPTPGATEAELKEKEDET